jgi:hypothetical protein
MRSVLLAVLVLLLLPAVVAAAPVPEGAMWTEEWIATPDGEKRVDRARAVEPLP